MPRKPTRDDIDKFHDYSIYLPTRTLYVGSEKVSEVDDFAESGCDAFMAERIVKNLHILDSTVAEPINIIMNNIGGDTYHCFAIYDAIRACKSHVVVKVVGHAMSAGSIILQAADERIMTPNSCQMIHYGAFAISGHAKTTQKWAEEGKRIDKWIEQMYLKRINEKNPDFKLATLQRRLNHDTFLSAQESVDLGLADKMEEIA
jgi:ATP-dependent protease ClpP protease subunit